MRIKTIEGAILHQLWVIVLVILIALGGGVLAIQEAPKTYQAQSTLFVDVRGNEGAALQQADGLLSLYYVQQVTSRRVLERAAATPALRGQSADALSRQVTATVVKATTTISVQARASTARRAADIANAVAQATVAQNRLDADSHLRQSIQVVQEQLTRLDDQLKAFRAQPLPPTDIRAADRAADITLVQNLYTATYNRFIDLNLTRARELDAVSVIQPASMPNKPVSPDPVVFMVAALVGGLVIGIFLALLRERLDDRLFTPESLGAALGAPVTLAAGTGSAADPFAVAQALLTSRHPKARRVLVAAASDGAEIGEVTRRFGMAAEKAGRRVLVLDGDIDGVTSKGNGKKPADNGAGADVAATLRRAPTYYDLTLVGVASPGRSPAGITLASSMDAAIVVATARKTTFTEARRSAEILRQAGVEPVAGILVGKKQKNHSGS